MSTTDLSENRGPELRATTIAIVVLACVFVGLRLTARRTTGMGLGMDDYTLLVALFFLFVATALALLGIHFGLGRHAGALTVPILVHWGKTLMAFECVYVTCVATIKVSLVMMYCRIFPIRNIRIGAYILGSLSIAWAISIIMVSIFQCTPIQKAWNSSLPGHCINLKKSFIGNAVPNFMTDIAILMLPMRQVWTLQTSMIQRAELSFVFLLGSFVVFTSIYRFSTLFQFEATDPSFTLATAWIWCVVESASGIISACLPTLGPFVKSAHRALGLSSAKSRSQPTRSNTALKTIGGSGGASRNLSNLESGIYDGSRSKGGSRPFKRLDEDGLSLEENSPPASKSGSKMTSNVGVHSIAGDGHSTDGDEIPLQGIRVRTDVEWSEEGKKIAARDNAARKI